MTCGLSCVGSYDRQQLKKFYDDGDWNDLAISVLKAGENNEQSWFYLASAAEGLGYDNAAQWYYFMSLVAPVPCKHPINICDGLDLPTLTESRLADLDKKLEKSQGFSQLQAPSGNPAYPIAIHLVKYQGNLPAPVLLDGNVPLLFEIDSGSATVNIPAGAAIILIHDGDLHRSDILGEGRGTLANGAVVRFLAFRIHSLQVGNLVLKNVIGTFFEGPGYLLLGQSFLNRFKSWSIDNAQGNLVLER
jgi:hypothetical protein